MKTMNSSVSRCLRVDFKAFEKIGENMYMLSWGVVPEMERVAVYDEGTGEHTFTGEVIRTDWVTYESGVFVGVLNVDSLAKVFESSTRQPSVSELASMCKGMELSDEEVIPFLKGWKVSELKAYDESSEVNDCIIVHEGNELHYWASKSERNDLKNAVRDYVAMGRTEYRLDLRDKGFSITLSCELLLQTLSALEIYAIDCYNRTTDHEFAIMALNTREEVSAYDYTVGYPEKLRFEA